MSLHFFVIPALQPQAAQDEFNAFCAAHRVVQVERQLVSAGARSFWALCATVAIGPWPLPAQLKRSGRSTAVGRAGGPVRMDVCIGIIDQMSHPACRQIAIRLRATNRKAPGVLVGSAARGRRLSGWPTFAFR